MSSTSDRSLRRDRQVDERLGDEGWITRRPGDADRFLGPRTDLVGGVDIGTPDDRQATEQRGPEAQLLRRQRVECVLEPAHPWEVGHERGDPQVGAGLGPRAGEGVRAPACQLCGLLVELQCGVQVAEPAQDLGQVEGHVREQFLAAHAFLADVPGSPRGDPRLSPAGRRRRARWPPGTRPRRQRRLLWCPRRPGAGARRRPPARRACRRCPMRVASRSCTSRASPSRVAASASNAWWKRTPLGATSVITPWRTAGMEPLAGFGRGAGVGEGEQREGRTRAGDRRGRQQRSSVIAEPIE